MKTKVKFLVHKPCEYFKDQTDEIFAYFPDEISFTNNGITFYTAYSHVGQHSACSPEYANESRNATPEEYADLKSELESIGYELEILN